MELELGLGLGSGLRLGLGQLADAADVAEQRRVGAQHGLRVQVGDGARVGVAHLARVRGRG